ncbi:alpha/beta family hydrolase [Leifsonia sp. McL0607]|uniref:alpha/beta hydrolase family protein n=1 Tax=Leifsonia sp. McL0607 TaxID=3415672 RepID=UPI003CEFD6BF
MDSAAEVVIEVPTAAGQGRLTVAAAAQPRALLWIGHGAGGGIGAADLVALASELPSTGITVARYEQPWRVAGRRVASRAPALDAAWLETAPAVDELAGGLPVIVGGRSAGARVACRTAGATGAAAVLCLAFPLHPPGRPDASRLDELLTPTVPTLVLQGDRDTFGGAELLRAAVEAAPGDRASLRVVTVPGADHGMKTLKSSPFGARDVRELIVATTSAFIDDVLSAPTSR